MIALKIMINFLYLKRRILPKNALNQKYLNGKKLNIQSKNWNSSENISIAQKEYRQKSIHRGKSKKNRKGIKTSQQKINDLLRESTPLILDNIDKKHNKINGNQ
ncbi:hypothetical protein [Alcaligenes sp. SDU_A2]|uniref:hypothetical protein n=1 Tax=Alcaligenes sp. SDU_A2 TaxID=3136634 RepID=UPI00312035CA